MYRKYIHNLGFIVLSEGTKISFKKEGSEVVTKCKHLKMKALGIEYRVRWKLVISADNFL
ncbi:MAG: hypothetical protein ABIH85_06015 [Candidatus Omnitrophota bacterium]